MIAGLAKPTSGQVLYRGRAFEGVNPGTAIVFQTFALYPWLTVLENVELGIQAGPSRRSIALKAIDTIGLDGYIDAYPRELSGLVCTSCRRPVIRRLLPVNNPHSR